MQTREWILVFVECDVFRCFSMKAICKDEDISSLQRKNNMVSLNQEIIKLMLSSSTLRVTLKQNTQLYGPHTLLRTHIPIARDLTHTFEKTIVRSTHRQKKGSRHCTVHILPTQEPNCRRGKPPIAEAVSVRLKKRRKLYGPQHSQKKRQKKRGRARTQLTF